MPMIRFDKSQEAVERRKQTHRCNGLCYGDDTQPCCPEIDTCEETANREFLATILAYLFIGFISLACLVGGLGFICCMIEIIIEAI